MSVESITANTKLENVIKLVNEYGPSPKHGEIVTRAYGSGKIRDLEDALRIIAELLDT